MPGGGVARSFGAEGRGARLLQSHGPFALHYECSGCKNCAGEALLRPPRKQSFCVLALFNNQGLMVSHSKVKRWEAALGYFRDEADTFEFNVALQACAVGAKPGWAVKLLQDLRQSGHEADSVSWTTTLTASRRHWKLTMGLLTQLRRELQWHWGRLNGLPEEALGTCHFSLHHTLRSATNAAPRQHSLDFEHLR